MNNHHLHYAPSAASWYTPQMGAPGVGYPVHQLPPTTTAHPNYQPILPPAYPPLPPAAPRTVQSLLGSSFVKGALVGGVAAYLLTNEAVQQGAIKAAVKAWSTLQGGVEEMKERFRDAEAELHAADLDQE